MKTLHAILLSFLLLLSPAYAFALDLFQSEQTAQQHCPNDIVVWLNLPTGVFHYKGQRWYGMTRHGAYVCKQEAMAEGDRATRSGQ